MGGPEKVSSKPAAVTKSASSPDKDIVINLDQGDPTVYEGFWGGKISEKCRVVITGNELMSYISDLRNVCWFMAPELETAIRRLHTVAGNAMVNGRHIVIGTGSTQIYHAALYALTSPGGDKPVPVVSASPYYSQYHVETDLVRSQLYKWGGDAHAHNKDGAFIEIVTSPNNPDGHTRESVVKSQPGRQGNVYYDLAYYWPQYTPITCSSDHDIMAFTFSKATGHAGSRIGWGIVKDEEIARKMVRYIELSSIGVSKDSQMRAAKLIGAIGECYEDVESDKSSRFFEYMSDLMAGRWKRLREAVAHSDVLTLPVYPEKHCLFRGEVAEAHPGFAWLKMKDGSKDCQKFLNELKIMSRGGPRFGVDPSYTRVSMLCRDMDFDRLLDRIAAAKTGTGDRK